MARACYEALREASGGCMGSMRLPAARLTAQELRVVNFVAAGMSNREVADALHVSVHTVKTHVKNLLDKLSIRSRWQVAGAVIELSLAGDSECEFRSSQIDILSARDGKGGGFLQQLV